VNEDLHLLQRDLVGVDERVRHPSNQTSLQFDIARWQLKVTIGIAGVVASLRSSG